LRASPREVPSAGFLFHEEATLKAVTGHGKSKVSGEEVPDPKLENRNDAIIQVTTSGT
jgi:hypothetical protein